MYHYCAYVPLCTIFMLTCMYHYVGLTLDMESNADFMSSGTQAVARSLGDSIIPNARPAELGILPPLSRLHFVLCCLRYCSLFMSYIQMHEFDDCQHSAIIVQDKIYLHRNSSGDFKGSFTSVFRKSPTTRGWCLSSGFVA